MRRLLIFIVATVVAMAPSQVPALAGGGPGFEAEVVGGLPAQPGEFPWMVRIEPDGCGGSLISPYVVLTAAHCLDSNVPVSSYTVTYGSVDLASPQAVTVTAAQLYPSPHTGLGHDWGLIQLSSPIVNVPTLPLATSPEFDTGVFQTMGWGSAPPGQGILHKVNALFVSDDECSEHYSNRDYRTILCATSGPGAGACFGDSGGPLIKQLPSGPVQVGILSFGRGTDCADGSPNGYMQVSWFAEEILGVASGLVRCGSITSSSDKSIPDLGFVQLNLNRPNCPGIVLNPVIAHVDIKHPYRGALLVDLFAPDGTRYVLKPYNSSDTGKDLKQTFVVDATVGGTRSGTWTVRVTDMLAGSVGHVDRWGIDLR